MLRRYVRPYIARPCKDYPSFRFDFAANRLGKHDGLTVQVYRITGRGPNDRTLIFEAYPYRPDLSAQDDARQMCADVVGFATAYVECPGEFERSPEDVEQVHADTWRRHDEALSCYLGR